MTERPILFSGPMVRAILEGRKTQTRRVLLCQPSGDVLDVLPPDNAYPRHWQFRYEHGGLDVPVPHSVGDTLWVRENWYCDDYRVQRGPYLKPDDMDLDQAREDGVLVYAADGLRPYEQEQPIWKPSIHMPRWASRISLKVTGVKVERLQDISELDAMAEGLSITPDGKAFIDLGPESQVHNTMRDCFCSLWTSINGVASWEANPWVVAYSFQRIKP